MRQKRIIKELEEYQTGSIDDLRKKILNDDASDNYIKLAAWEIKRLEDDIDMYKQQVFVIERHLQRENT